MRRDYDRLTGLRTKYAERAIVLYIQTRLRVGLDVADRWLAFVRGNPGRRDLALDYWQVCKDLRTTRSNAGWWTCHHLQEPPGNHRDSDLSSEWNPVYGYTKEDPLGSRNRPGWEKRNPEVFEQRRAAIYKAYTNAIRQAGGQPLSPNEVSHSWFGLAVDREMCTRMMRMGPPPEKQDEPKRGAMVDVSKVTIQLPNKKERARYTVCCVRSRIKYAGDNYSPVKDITYWTTQLKKNCVNYSQRANVFSLWEGELSSALPSVHYDRGMMVGVSQMMVYGHAAYGHKVYRSEGLTVIEVVE